MPEPIIHGPWRASLGHEGWIVNLVTDEDRPGSGVATLCKVLPLDGEAESVATMMSAAPNLWQACEALVRAYAGLTITHPHLVNQEIVRQGIAAIAKTSGEG